MYGPERVAPPPVPPELASRDDVNDVHYVPAPCQVACPIGTDAPSYIAHIWEGKLEEAFEAITATNPFSSVCGRVCDAPCEPACRRADSDGPLAIRNLKRYVMDRLGATWRPEPVAVTRSETVGIVGGGPAGLTAAQDLAEAGLRGSRLRADVDARRLHDVGDPGVSLPARGVPGGHRPPARALSRASTSTSTPRSARDVTLDELKERHDAVLLTIGAWWGKGVRLAGGEAANGRVVDGVTFLRRVNGGERPTLPEQVLVIGAGDVAMDACRAARRLPGCERRQGAVPPRARRDSRPQGRAARRDRGGHRDRLQHPAGRCRDRRGRESRAAVRAHRARRAGRGRPAAARWTFPAPSTTSAAGSSSSRPARRPSPSTWRARADGGREGADRLGHHAHRRPAASSPPATGRSGRRRS